MKKKSGILILCLLVIIVGIVILNQNEASQTISLANVRKEDATATKILKKTSLGKTNLVCYKNKKAKVNLMSFINGKRHVWAQGTKTINVSIDADNNGTMIVFYGDNKKMSIDSFTYELSNQTVSYNVKSETIILKALLVNQSDGVGKGKAYNAKHQLIFEF